AAWELYGTWDCLSGYQSKYGLHSREKRGLGRAVSPRDATFIGRVLVVEVELVAAGQVPVEAHRPLFGRARGFLDVGEAQVEGSVVNRERAHAHGELDGTEAALRGIERRFGAHHRERRV